VAATNAQPVPGTSCIEPQTLLRDLPTIQQQMVKPVLLYQICEDGVATRSKRPVFIDNPEDTPHPNPSASVTVNEGFPTRTTFQAPHNATLDLISKRTLMHLFEDARIDQFGSPSGQSDVTQVSEGKVGFWVSALSKLAGALGNPTVGVLVDQILCVSKDTVFDVDVQPHQSATFNVSDGSLSLTRTISVRLVAEKLTIDAIRQTDVLVAGRNSTITYTYPLKTLEFANALEAREYFTKQLQDATDANDEPRIEDAAFDIQRIHAFVPPPIVNLPRTRGAKFPWWTTLVAGGIIYGIVSSSSSKSVMPPTATGSVGVMGREFR
jgi:hypothetical protein